MTAHVRRYHGSGHVWQGRFKAFPIQEDEHLRTVLRYVERNPLRAGLVRRAEARPWSSRRWWSDPRPPAFLDPGPAPRGAGWVEAVNAAMFETELARVRHSLRRGTPFGSDPWARHTADRLGLGASLNPRGRPPIAEKT